MFDINFRRQSLIAHRNANLAGQNGLRTTGSCLIRHLSFWTFGKTSMSKLSIVMYHYVRDPERSRYPRIKVRGKAPSSPLPRSWKGNYLK